MAYLGVKIDTQLYRNASAGSTKQYSVPLSPPTAMQEQKHSFGYTAKRRVYPLPSIIQAKYQRSYWMKEVKRF
jgi:hypothetical protein